MAFWIIPPTPNANAMGAPSGGSSDLGLLALLLSQNTNQTQQGSTSGVGGIGGLLGGGASPNGMLGGGDPMSLANMGGLGALAGSYANGSGGSNGSGMSGFGMTGTLPNGMTHDNQAMQYPGEGIGAAIGSIWGMPGLGAMAGKNAGYTVGDLMGGNTNALGWDVSSNLPPGLQATGGGGLLNGATGLPLAQLFGWK